MNTKAKMTFQAIKDLLEVFPDREIRILTVNGSYRGRLSPDFEDNPEYISLKDAKYNEIGNPIDFFVAIDKIVSISWLKITIKVIMIVNNLKREISNYDKMKLKSIRYL